MQHFREIGEPVKQRNFYWGELPSLESQFAKAGEACMQKFDDPALAHLTEEQKDNVLKKHVAMTEFFTKVREDRTAKADSEDPAFTLADISAKISSFKTETNAIFATPPPKPEEKKEEKKEEDAKMEGAEEKKEESAAGPEVPP